jgi:hypothetical protein
MFLGLELPDINAKDHGPIDAMAARHPTWDRGHPGMQLYWAKAAAHSRATWVANG